MRFGGRDWESQTLDPDGISRGAVRLAPLHPRDRLAFLQASRSSRSLHRPWVHPPTTSDGFDDFANASDPRRQRFLLWSRRETEPVVLGYFSLGEIIGGNLRSAFLGYWVAAAHARQGWMSQGMELVLQHAFKRLRLHRLEANIQPDNAASIALARGAQFRYEGYSPRYLKVGGRWRDHERWAMTVEQWRARSRRPTRTGSPPRASGARTTGRPDGSGGRVRRS